jgi:hypothetical protein
MDCIDNILNYYQSKDTQNLDAINSWICNILVNLLEDLVEINSQNFLRVRNCLILLINLFFNVDYPEDLNIKGKTIEELTDDERSQVLQILKSEIINLN